MANTLSQPLAEALVKVKLVYDSTELKRSTDKSIAQATKAINVSANKYDAISRYVSKASGLIFKSLIAPITGLGTLGVNKFMQTTSVDAGKLRMSMAGLTWSFNQFLARIGRVIFESGILTKVIEKLKKFLDSMSDDKIKAFLDKAKWAFVLGVVGKMLTMFIDMRKNVILLGRDLAKLGIANPITKSLIGQTAGYVGGGIAGGGIVGGAVAGGIASVYGKNGGPASGKMLSWIKTELRLSFQWLKRSFNYLQVSIKSLINSIKTTGTLGEMTGFKIVFGQIIKGLSIFINTILTIVGKLLKILIIFDVIHGMMKGFGFDFKSVFGALWTIVKSIGYTLEIFSQAVVANTEYLIDALHFGKGWSKRLEDDQKENEKRRFDIYQKYFGKEGETGKFQKNREDMFRFLPENTSSTSFAGLNAAAQAMITAENEMKSRDMNTAALDRLTEAVNKNGGASGSWSESFKPNEDYRLNRIFAPGMI